MNDQATELPYWQLPESTWDSARAEAARIRACVEAGNYDQILAGGE